MLRIFAFASTIYIAVFAYDGLAIADSACGGWNDGDCRNCERQTPYPSYTCYVSNSCNPCTTSRREFTKRKAAVSKLKP